MQRVFRFAGRVRQAEAESRGFTWRPNCISAVSRTRRRATGFARSSASAATCCQRSEEHTSELQSLAYLVCRLLLEKKKKKNQQRIQSCRQTNNSRTHSTSTARIT